MTVLLQTVVVAAPGRSRFLTRALRVFGMTTQSGVAGWTTALSDQVHQVAGHATGVVAGDSAFVEVVAEHGDYAEGFDGVEIVDDLAGAFAGVLDFEFVGHGSAVDQREIENLFLGVAIEGADVVGRGQVE